MYFGTILQFIGIGNFMNNSAGVCGGVISAWEGKAILLLEGDSKFAVNSATLGGSSHCPQAS